MKAYHMSPVVHPAGRILEPNGLPKVDEAIEDALEGTRPKGAFSRPHSVYAIQTPDFSLVGMDAGYIYRVEMPEEFERHDLRWIGELQKAHWKPKHDHHPVIARTWPDWTASFVSECCGAYWSGHAFGDAPVWELLAPSATVDAQLSAYIVQATETRGGWNGLK
ncbi:MAG TPA: hypothetical protein VIF34_06885 [Methylocystis sp.]|jgi:hypothetical protein